MLVFGGGLSNTKPSTVLWKYHFPSQMWKKQVSQTHPNPSSKAYHCILGLGPGFQESADSFSTSVSFCLHPKDKGCSKLLTISKHHACFCEYIGKEPTYQTFSNENGCEIEMRTFRQSEEEPDSSKTTSSAELSANPSPDTLSKETRISVLNLPGEQDEEKKAGFSYSSSDSSFISESPAVLLLIGGKPLAGSSTVSFWQMELEGI